LKETIPAEFKERAQQAVQDSIKIMEEGKRYIGHVRARLEFLSTDSESGSYKGPAGTEATAWHQAPEELNERSRMEEGSTTAPSDLVSILRGWGQLRANNSGWPTFDGWYASYTRFKREWRAYRETYHSVLNDDLATKTLREKCVKGNAFKMVSHLDDLREIRDTLDTCFERPEKYMEETLRPIVELRKYKATDSSAVREFYSVLRAAIKGARSIGRLSLLINDQTVPRIMSKMPYTDWKEWAKKRPEWMGEDLGPTFEKFVERKWQDALNVATAGPQSWGLEKERVTAAKGATEKVSQGYKGTAKVTGAVNVVNQQPPRGRVHQRGQPPVGEGGGARLRRR
jgi:hypothetical protein